MLERLKLVVEMINAEEYEAKLQIDGRFFSRR